MNKTKNVKILSGLYKGEIGILGDTFDYHGKTLRVIKIPQVYSITGQSFYCFTTVNENEYEYTDKKLHMREVKYANF